MDHVGRRRHGPRAGEARGGNRRGPCRRCREPGATLAIQTTWLGVRESPEATWEPRLWKARFDIATRAPVAPTGLSRSPRCSRRCLDLLGSESKPLELVPGLTEGASGNPSASGSISRGTGWVVAGNTAPAMPSSRAAICLRGRSRRRRRPLTKHEVAQRFLAEAADCERPSDGAQERSLLAGRRLQRASQIFHRPGAGELMTLLVICMLTITVRSVFWSRSAFSTQASPRPPPRTTIALFDRDGLGKVARLVDVEPSRAGDAIREQLQRDNAQDDLQ